MPPDESPQAPVLAMTPEKYLEKTQSELEARIATTASPGLVAAAPDGTAPHSCTLCMRPNAQQQCAACANAYYCSPTCQNIDLPCHGGICRALAALGARPSPRHGLGLLLGKHAGSEERTFWTSGGRRGAARRAGPVPLVRGSEAWAACPDDDDGDDDETPQWIEVIDGNTRVRRLLDHDRTLHLYSACDAATGRSQRAPNLAVRAVASQFGIPEHLVRGPCLLVPGPEFAAFAYTANATARKYIRRPAQQNSRGTDNNASSANANQDEDDDEDDEEAAALEEADKAWKDWVTRLENGAQPADICAADLRHVADWFNSHYPVWQWNEVLPDGLTWGSVLAADDEESKARHKISGRTVKLSRDSRPEHIPDHDKNKDKDTSLDTSRGMLSPISVILGVPMRLIPATRGAPPFSDKALGNSAANYLMANILDPDDPTWGRAPDSWAPEGTLFLPGAVYVVREDGGVVGDYPLLMALFWAKRLRSRVDLALGTGTLETRLKFIEWANRTNFDKYQRHRNQKRKGKKARAIERARHNKRKAEAPGNKPEEEEQEECLEESPDEGGSDEIEEEFLDPIISCLAMHLPCP
ncbi:hypothetical protein F4780DRAFT_794697 [Xylariomycetidae sp. FL0641]|nr:hypothetical protein F4780DRAFT_794697 [Xylariomycetidae sp. FL0641]